MLASILIASNAIVESPRHVTQVHVFVDSVSAAQRAFDMGIHSLQGSSLSISERLRFWFDVSSSNQLTFHYVPSGTHWNIQYSAYKLSKSISIADTGNISLDVKLKEITSGCLKEWSKLFQSPDYRGHQFLFNPDTVPPPSHLKGGPWSLKDVSLRMSARFYRTVLNHAPIGEYRKRFLKHLPSESHYCRCGALETWSHLLFQCPFLKQNGKPTVVLSKKGLLNFLKVNWMSFAFDREGVGWEVGASLPLLSRPRSHSETPLGIDVEPNQTVGAEVVNKQEWHALSIPSYATPPVVALLALRVFSGCFLLV